MWCGVAFESPLCATAAATHACTRPHSSCKHTHSTHRHVQQRRRRLGQWREREFIAFLQVVFPKNFCPFLGLELCASARGSGRGTCVCACARLSYVRAQPPQPQAAPRRAAPSRTAPRVLDPSCRPMMLGLRTRSPTRLPKCCSAQSPARPLARSCGPFCPLAARPVAAHPPAARPPACPPTRSPMRPLHAHSLSPTPFSDCLPQATGSRR